MRWFYWTLPLALTTACSGDVEDPGHDHNHDHEVITTVELAFTPDGGATEVFTWSDVDGGDPVADTITLTSGTTYTLDVSFLNELEDPAEDITPEVRDEGEDHQLFFLGSALDGLITHNYDDVDGTGLPIGLQNTVTAVATGSGDLRVVLQHMPEEDGTAIKVAGLADDVAASGVGGLPGGADTDVTLPVVVQ